MKATGWFQLVVGGAILALWALLLVAGDVPESAAGQRDIWFHLAAEVVTAVLLLAAGVALLRRATARARTWSGVALGALLYTAVNSAGYYAEQSGWAAVGMFAVLTVLTAVAVVGLVRFTDAPAPGPPVAAPALQEAVR